MDRNVRIPLIIILVTLIMHMLSGEYPLSMALFMLLIVLPILLIGKKVNWDHGRMMLWGLPLALVILALYIGLLLLSKSLPWLKSALIWPTG